MGEHKIVKEVKKAEKIARNFLEGKLEIPNPTPDQIDIMTRIVFSNNGAMTLDDLLTETKKVLIGQGFYHPEKGTILNWMLAVVINKSVSLSNSIIWQVLRKLDQVLVKGRMLIAKKKGGGLWRKRVVLSQATMSLKKE